MAKEISGPSRERSLGGPQKAERKEKPGKMRFIQGEVPVYFNRNQQMSLIEKAKLGVKAVGAKGIATPKHLGGIKGRKVGGKKSKKGGGPVDVEVEKEEEKKVEEKGGIRRVREVIKRGRRGEYEGLAARLERLAKQKEILGLQEIIDEAWGPKGEFKDVTDAYDALRALQEDFAESEDETLKRLSNSTLAAATDLYTRNKPDIIAGNLFGPGTDETVAYREYVIRFEKPSETFGAIMERAKGKEKLFQKETERLIKLIQIDMKAQESTMDPVHLKHIMDGLYKVQMCAQVHEDGKILLRDMKELYEKN